MMKSYTVRTMLLSCNKVVNGFTTVNTPFINIWQFISNSDIIMFKRAL